MFVKNGLANTKYAPDGAICLYPQGAKQLNTAPEVRCSEVTPHGHGKTATNWLIERVLPLPGQSAFG